MAQPKKRKSRSRARMTRAVWMASANARIPSLVKCAHCGARKPGHSVCPDCGWYAGRQVMKVESD